MFDPVILELPCRFQRHTAKGVWLQWLTGQSVSFQQKGAADIAGHLPTASWRCTADTWGSERSRGNTWVRALEIPWAKPATVPHKPESEWSVSCALRGTPGRGMVHCWGEGERHWKGGGRTVTCLCKPIKVWQFKGVLRVETVWIAFSKLFQSGNTVLVFTSVFFLSKDRSQRSLAYSLLTRYANRVNRSADLTFFWRESLDYYIFWNSLCLSVHIVWVYHRGGWPNFPKLACDMISLTCSLAVIPPIVLHSSSGRVAQSKLQEGKKCWSAASLEVCSGSGNAAWGTADCITSVSLC